MEKEMFLSNGYQNDNVLDLTLGRAVPGCSRIGLTLGKLRVVEVD